MSQPNKTNPARGSRSQWNVQPTSENIVIGELHAMRKNEINQKAYESITERICKTILESSSIGVWTEDVLANVGLTHSATAQLAKKNNGTFLKDLRFAKLISFHKQIDYIINDLDKGCYFLIGRSNAARHHSHSEEVKGFKPKEYLSSVVIRKEDSRTGVIEITVTVEDKLEVQQSELTSENLRYYFADTYVLYYFSEEGHNSTVSATVPENLGREKREKRHLEHRARQNERVEAAKSSSKFSKKQKNRGVKRGRNNKTFIFITNE